MKAYSKDKSPVSRTILTFFEQVTRREVVPHISKTQSVSALSGSLTSLLSSYALPTEIQEQVSQHVVTLEELAQTINLYKSKYFPMNFYDAIQEEKLKMRQIAETLTD